MTIGTFDPSHYQKVPGDPAFPPVSRSRQEDYIERMIERDRRYEKRDNTRPFREEKL